MSDESTTAEVASEQPDSAPYKDSATATAPLQADSGQIMPIVSNEENQASSPAEETVAQVAPQSPESSAPISDGGAATDATTATPGADAGKSAEAIAVDQNAATNAEVVQDETKPVLDETTPLDQTSPTTAEVVQDETKPVLDETTPLDQATPPDPVAELTASLATERQRTAELIEARDVLQARLELATNAIDDQRRAFEDGRIGIRAEVLALVDRLNDQLCEFAQQAQAVGAVPVGERLRVFLRQPAIVAEAAREIGTTLAYVTLAEGVSLNFLVDAIRNGIAKGK
jgi:hypothetical protein